MKRKFVVFALFAVVAVAVFAASVKVYATPSGKKYHLRSCRTLSRSTQILEFTVEQARAAGLEPCKVCAP